MNDKKLKLTISVITMMIISVIIIGLAIHNDAVKSLDSNSDIERITTTIIETNNQNETNRETETEEKEEKAVLNCTSTVPIASNEYYKTELEYVKVTLDNEIAYSLDYNLALPRDNGVELSKIRKLNPLTASGLVYGYPNVSPKELGVESKDEARMATQFAIWRLAQSSAADDAKDSEYIFDMVNLLAYDGYENYMERVELAAEKIVDKAIKDPYVSFPKFSVDNEKAKLKLSDNEFMLAGPYIIDGKGYNITNIKVLLEGAPESAVLCDIDGNEKSSFENGDSIYIKMAKTENGKKFTLRVESEGNHSEVFAYGTDKDIEQNFCVLETVEDKLTILVDIILPVLSGGINVKIIDQQENIQCGVKVRIKDTLGNELKIAETDENGCALFENLPVGEYVISPLGEEDNIFMYDSVHSKVEYQKINDLTIKSTLIEGKFQLLAVEEDKTTPISGITFQILDENKNVIQTLVSDEDGMILSKSLIKGKYYYREIAAPDYVYTDNKEIEFEITKLNEVHRRKLIHYNGKGKLQITCTDNYNKPVGGATFEIYSKTGDVIATITTGDDGVALSEYINLSEYSYACVSAPESVFIDNTKYEFAISVKMQTVQVEYQFENK